MTPSLLNPPAVDPTAIFELFRGSYGSELLTAATCHFDLFGRLAQQGKTFDQLREELGLETRPANVLVTALRAMGLLQLRDEQLELTSIAHEHLVPGGEFDVGNYVGLAAESPGVLSMVNLLKTNRPLGSDGDDSAGTAYIYRDGNVSAMDAEQTARHFTMALAGRAKNVAPLLAANLDLKDSSVVLDVAGGTGIYCYALLQKYPHLRGIIFDRPEVLKIAEAMAAEYGVLDRTQFVAGDMFADEFPADADCVLLSNVLHDWNVPECEQIVQRCAAAIRPGGKVIIHDVFLNDALDGPLPIALYSAALFSLTEGRAYSAAEYNGWLTAAGLTAALPIPTLIHCGAIVAQKFV
jgi:SAM-dependent methyltransferase